MPSLGKFLLFFWIISISIESHAKDRFGKKYYGGQRGSHSRRSSLSKSNLKYLFPTAAALGGIYIASRMRPNIHLRSYRDLYHHTVCEGRHAEIDTRSNDVRIYSHFLCPDDPDQPFERYCCWDKLRQSGVCCSYDEKVRYYTYSRWGLLGGAISVVCVIVVVGLLVYCLCCRRHRRPRCHSPAPVYAPQAPETYMTPPTKAQALPDQTTPSCPYPIGPGVTTYPSPQQAPTSVPPPVPQPGSGWAAPTSNLPGSAWTDVPPPPYSAVQEATTQASAPPLPQ